jgi:hypothetical protein
MPQKSKSKRLLRSYKNVDNENVIKDLNELNLDFSNFFVAIFLCLRYSSQDLELLCVLKPLCS